MPKVVFRVPKDQKQAFLTSANTAQLITKNIEKGEESSVNVLLQGQASQLKALSKQYPDYVTRS